MDVLDRPETEEYFGFYVTQLAPETFLEGLIGAEFIRLPPLTVTEIHRHNGSENVIFVISGNGTLVLDDKEARISRGDRVRINKGSYHGFRTEDDGLEFVTIHMPPIMNKKTGWLDRELKPE